MKKTITYFIALLILLITSSSIFSQVTFRMKRAPLGQLRSADLWNATIINTGEAFTAYIYGSLTNNENSELIATGQTMTFEVKKGTTNFKISDLPRIPDISYLSKDPKYKKSFMNTGGAPPGDYKICCELRRTDNTVAGEDCFAQKITGGDAPQLIAPRNDSELPGDNPNPVFTWMHTKAPGSNQTYTLRIVELIGNQPPEEAMKRNKAFFEVEGISPTLFQYPSTASKFEEEKNYAWAIEVNQKWSDIWIIRPRPRKPTCKDFKVNIVKNNKGENGEDGEKRDKGDKGDKLPNSVVNKRNNGSACCYDISITNNYGGIAADRPESFRITVNNTTIISAAGLPAGWSQTPATVPPNTNNIDWKKASGYIPSGVTNLGTICFGKIVTDPFYITYEWLSDRGKVLCRDSVKVSCRDDGIGCNQYGLRLFNNIPNTFKKVKIIPVNPSDITGFSIDDDTEDWNLVTGAGGAYYEFNYINATGFIPADPANLIDVNFIVRVNQNISNPKIRVLWLDVNNVIGKEEELTLAGLSSAQLADENFEYDWTVNTALISGSYTDAQLFAGAEAEQCRDFNHGIIINKKFS